MLLDGAVLSCNDAAAGVINRSAAAGISCAANTSSRVCVALWRRKRTEGMCLCNNEDSASSPMKSFISQHL